MKTYVVKQGEYLAKIAAREGIGPADIWNDAGNKDLVARRKSPDLLAAGDVLRIPDVPARAPLSVKPATTNSFTADPPAVALPMVFSVGGEVLANATYEVRGAGPVATGTTDGAGKATITVTTVVDFVDVVFTDSSAQFRLKIGHLDPPNVVSGAQQRLRALGYLARPSLGERRGAAQNTRAEKARAEALARALRAFQTDNGLEVTGELDDATADGLASVYGA